MGPRRRETAFLGRFLAVLGRGLGWRRGWVMLGLHQLRKTR